VNARTVNHAFQKVVAKPGNTVMERALGYLTPLHLAARQGALEAAEVLVRAGADLKAIDPVHGFTPLLTAVINGNYAVATMLIDNGADVDDGSLYLAVEMRNLDKYTNRPNPPDRDRDRTAMDVLTRLLARGAWVDSPFYYTVPQWQTQGTIRPIDGGTPLYRAIKSVDLEAARVLVKYGADASQAASDGSTPLMLLSGAQARRDEEEVVDAGTRSDPLDGIRLLLDAGADVNAADYSGNTALHMAAARQADRIIELLAARGARVDVRNAQGRTPLDIARGAPLTRPAGGRGGAAVAPAPRPLSPAQQATAALLERLAARQ
jgi:ankyrin repeat protein